MAIKRGGNLVEQRPSDDSGYLSDESEFYGDEATINELEHRAGTLDVAEWWQQKTPSLTEIANSNISASEQKRPATLYNPYEGKERCARQLGETVQEFLQRLPPSTTRTSSLMSWIYIANPFRKTSVAKLQGDARESLGEEGPPEEGSQWARFVVRAGELLEELTGARREIEKERAGQAKGQLTKAVNSQTDKTVRKILDTALELRCTSGKWMMFCPAGEVDAVWAVVARATAENGLGSAAKVAPDNGEGKERLICIYTKDFNDMEDVTRVLRKMKELGLVDSREKPLYYKCDAFTYLRLTSNNEYNIRASLYNSADILAGKVDKSKGQKKLKGFSYKKRAESDEWRQMES